MVADTFSSTLGVQLMGTGNDNNTWGNNCNSLVFQILEDAIANTLTSTVAGGTLDLSGSPPPAAASQVRYNALVFNGALGSDQIIQVPNLPKFWWVNNATSGAHTIKIKTPGGSASSALPQNAGWQIVHCDGANGIIVEPFNSVSTGIGNSDPTNIHAGFGIAAGSAGTVGTIAVNPTTNANDTTSALVVQVNDQLAASTYGGTGYEYAIVGTIKSTHDGGSLDPNKVGVFGACELSGANSGDGWGGNFVVVADFTSKATSIGTGVEIDVNNSSPTPRNFFNLGAPMYGLQVTGDSLTTCTAAILLSGQPAKAQWNSGISFNNFRAVHSAAWGIEFGALDAGTSFVGAAIYCHAAVDTTYVAHFVNTAATGNSDEGILVGAGGTAGTESNFLVVFVDRGNSVVVGSIGRNGAGGTVYNTISDVRLKTKIDDIDGTEALDRLMQVRPRKFAMKSNLDVPVSGFIAQELVDKYPHAVTKGGDDPVKEPWMLDTSPMMPDIVAAIQELTRRVDQLSKKA